MRDIFTVLKEIKHVWGEETKLIVEGVEVIDIHDNPNLVKGE